MPKPAVFWKTLTGAQRMAFYAGLGIVIALAVVVLGAFVVQAAYAGKIMPNTTVAGLDIGGQKADQAARILTDQAHWLTTTKITLAFNNTKQSLSASDLGLSVNLATAQNQIVTPSNQFGWLHPSFWQEFFRHKTVPLTFSKSDEDLKQVISQKFSITAAPKDASLSVVNGALTVVPDQPGETINTFQLKSALMTFFLTGNSAPIALQPESQAPAAISAAAAGTVKDQINAALHPVPLTANGKITTISVTDQYALLDYTTDTGVLKWQISESKLTSYLNSVIAKNLSVKAVQQVIENDTNRIITAGVDGAAVDVQTLEPKVFQAMTGSNAKPSALAVPFKTVAFTIATVNPSYTLNLFPGLYLDVSLSTQRITVITGNTILEQYRISSGGWSTPTPIGTLYIFNKIKLAYSPEFKLWMPDWNGLATNPDGSGYLGYGIHAIVCWDKACTNREGANHIGTPVSHGCIRVDDTGIAYIYDSAPIGTPVVIHQ